MIYFDNASTTKPCEKAVEAAKTIENLYANPSSVHSFGIEAEKMLSTARETISKTIGKNSNEIIFTSGGTEANVLAICGSIREGKKEHFITTSSEHPSVKETMDMLEKRGHEVDRIPVDEKGHMKLEIFSDKLRKDTRLVSVIHVNNETGCIQDINTIGKIIKDSKSRALFHVDGVQGFLKHPLPLDNAFVDLYSASAHKVHGFKGTGFLFVRENVRVSPIFFGGDQEKGIRPGTENMLGIVALEKAISCFYEGDVEAIKKELMTLTELTDVYINTASESPYVLNMSFVGIPSEVLVNALSIEGVFVSAGAACSTKQPTSLAYLPIDKSRVNSAIRLSFSQMNTLKEAKTAKEIIFDTVIKLRKQIGGTV